MLGEQTSNKTISYLTVVVLIGMALLTALNFSNFFLQPKNEKYLSYNDVRGMAVVHRSTPYTLNFDQQNHVIEYINRSVQITSDKYSQNEPIDFDSLVIYLFNAPDIILKPIGYQDNNLIYSVPQWNPQGYMKDMTLGKFKDLLSSSYDH